MQRAVGQWEPTDGLLSAACCNLFSVLLLFVCFRRWIRNLSIQNAQTTGRTLVRTVVDTRRDTSGIDRSSIPEANPNLIYIAMVVARPQWNWKVIYWPDVEKLELLMLHTSFLFQPCTCLPGVATSSCDWMSCCQSSVNLLLIVRKAGCCLYQHLLFWL